MTVASVLAHALWLWPATAPGVAIEDRVSATPVEEMPDAPRVDPAEPPPVLPSPVLRSSVSVPAPAPPPEISSKAPPPPPTPAVSTATGWFRIESLFQIRSRQTWASIKPELADRVRREHPVSAEPTLQLIEDTARASDGIHLRWASLRFTAEPTDTLRAAIEIDFARLLDSEDASRAIWEAPVTLVPMKGLQINAGLLHVPFSVLETVEPSEFELAEKGPAHELLEEQLSLARRNIGATVDVTPLREDRWLRLTAGAFQGTTAGATGAQDFRGPGLFAGRVLAEPIEHVRVGASVAWRPWPTLEWWDELRYRVEIFSQGVAVATHATVTFPRFLLRGEWMTGTRTDVDIPSPLQNRRGGARHFMAAWGMAVFRFPVGGMVLMPAVRAEWLDTDYSRLNTDAERVGILARPEPWCPAGRILHFSAGVHLEMSDHARVLLDVSRHDVQPGTRNGEYHEIVRYDTDSTSVVLQLQIKV